MNVLHAVSTQTNAAENNERGANDCRLTCKLWHAQVSFRAMGEN